MARRPVPALIDVYARQLGLDPRAVKSVAMGEGGLRWGAVGDGGHAFGPFQMNDAGGVLTNRFGSSEARAQFANSEAGVREAMTAMARHAKGLTGKQAINAIVSKYERPADIPGSISKAWGRYGSIGGSSQAALSPSRPGSPVFQAEAVNDDRQKAVHDWANAGLSAYLNGSDQATPLAMFMEQARRDGAVKPLPSLSPGSTTSGKVTPTLKPQKGLQSGAEGVKAAIAYAQGLGLRVSENPFVDKVDPVHVKNSDHYNTYGGTNVGHAMDVSGDPAKIKQYFKWVEGNRGKLGLDDAFYTPMGYSYDEGGRTSYLQPRHDDHGHFSFR